MDDADPANWSPLFPFQDIKLADTLAPTIDGEVSAVMVEE
jgi:hypothetical protein